MNDMLRGVHYLPNGGYKYNRFVCHPHSDFAGLCDPHPDYQDI